MLNRHLKPLLIEWRDITQGAYPDFVRQAKPGPLSGVLPIFSFHTVTPDGFEAELKFLKDNGYHTVIADEAVRFVKGELELPEQSVMLSFDDGRLSVWAVIYPLLKKYGFRATVFLTPDLVRPTEGLSPNLEDVWKGRAELSDIAGCDQFAEPAISWQEAAEMEDSGVIDFQGHTLGHRRIPVGPKIVDFVHPGRIKHFFFRFQIPWMREGENDPYRLSQWLGAPVYESAPFYHEGKLYLEDVSLRQVCVGYVQSNGGESFFDQPDWRKQLEDVVDSHAKETNAWESESDQKIRMARDLKACKEKIESHLPGKKVTHLAYPWGGGCPASIEASKETGYVSNFWSTIPGQPINKPGDDATHLVRLKHDFIWRLPGKGRKSFLNTFGQKFLRRAMGRLDY